MKAKNSMESGTAYPTVRVVTDSTADIPQEMAVALDITVIPANVHFGTETFLDGVNLNKEEFYRRMVEGPVLPTTSAPAPGTFSATYRALWDQARASGRPLEGIVSIHLPAHLSAILNSAHLGAQGVPEARIRLLDSQQLSFGTGWLAVLAAKAAQAGKNLEQVVALVRDLIPRLRLIAMLDTLEYVRRSGRLGAAQWLLGSLLHIKPLLEVRHGEVRPLPVRARTRAQALDRLAEIAAQMGPFEELAVMHANAPEVGRELLARIAHLHPPERIVFGEIGVTIGTYAGPGAVGIIGIIAKRD